MERRLAAIMAADLAGYSALMERDETGTLTSLRSELDGVIIPEITRHKGRVVKLMGDGVLAEFPSVLAAVAAAVRIQQSLTGRAPATPQGDPLRFRIGINLGDVIIEDEDIYGDGVNVAARVEALAPPGEVCITRPVRDQVRDKLDWLLEDWGQIEVKNLSRPVRVFRVVTDSDEAAAISARMSATRRAKVRRVSGLVAALLAVLAATDLNVAATRTASSGAALLQPAWDVTMRTGHIEIQRAANLRQGPGLSFDVVTVAQPGAKLALTGAVTAGPWLQVQDPNAKGQVFVHESLARVVQPTALGSEQSAALRPSVEAASALVPVPLAAPPEAPIVTSALAEIDSQDVWVTVSFDFSDGTYTNCSHVSSSGAQLLTVGGDGWQNITFSGHDNFNVYAKAERREGALAVLVWPYPGTWSETSAIAVALPGDAPGVSGRAFTTRRAQPPHHACGPFGTYVTVVAEPEE